MSTPKRPSSFDDAIVREAAEVVFPEYAKWCSDGIPDDEREAAIKSLMRAMRYEHDGYRIVRELESIDYIDGDEELVTIMSGAHSEIYRAQQKAEKRWVADNGIVPQFAIGTRVKHQRGEGVIDRIEADTGRYIVRGDKDAPRCGALVPFEDAIEVTGAQS